MIGYKEYAEQQPKIHKGNYVAVRVSDIPKQYVSSLNGEMSDDPHITLMYSPKTDVGNSIIDYILKKYDIRNSYVKVTGVDVFPKSDGDTDLACIVLLIEDSRLNDIHNGLKRIGCVSTYDVYRPHCTLMYNIPKEQAEITANLIRGTIMNSGIYLKTTTYINEELKKIV